MAFTIVKDYGEAREEGGGGEEGREQGGQGGRTAAAAYNSLKYWPTPPLTSQNKLRSVFSPIF